MLCFRVAQDYKLSCEPHIQGEMGKLPSDPNGPIMNGNGQAYTKRHCNQKSRVEIMCDEIDEPYAANKMNKCRERGCAMYFIYN